MKNLYAILNVGPISSSEEIKAAYRMLAKKHHPDKGGDPRRFQDIQEVYETLCNPASRQEYDKERNRRPFDGASFRIAKPQATPEPMDIFDDIIDVIGRGFGMARVFRFEADIVLSPREAAEGANLSIEIPVERICGACLGFGGTVFRNCSQCAGNGAIVEIKRLKVRVDSGVRTGEIVKIGMDNIEITGRIVIER